MTTETVKQVDIQLVQIKEQVWVVPQSIHGMLWLQTHFENDAWDALGTDAVIIPRQDAGMLVIDAQSAELMVVYDG